MASTATEMMLRHNAVTREDYVRQTIFEDQARLVREEWQRAKMECLLNGHAFDSETPMVLAPRQNKVLLLCA